ncbi:methyltransferase domain-containing protein [Edaphobacter sp. 4G125]|nr:methyltransferase domain-containing protein [Edaphobacter sp. 4G125]
MQFAWGYVPTMVLEAAIHHRVFDVLNESPKTLKETATATGASERGLRAIMNVLVGLNFLEKEGDRYKLTPESDAFLVSTKPSFQGGLLRHTSEHLVPKWLRLNEIVKTGGPGAGVNQESDGTAFFQSFVMDIFPMSYPSATTLASHLALEKRSKPVEVLDIAAGSGVWGIALAQSAENVSVTAVDWEGVLPVTQSSADRFGLLDRFSFIAGDLNKVDFGTGYDVATLGHILHSEGEAKSRHLLRKVFDALASKGTIAIAEFLVNPDRTGPVGSLMFAANMLVNTDEGDTYSFEEISLWLKDAGFTDMRLLDVPGPSPLVLATKP